MRNSRGRKNGGKSKFGKCVGVMSILMYDSINQQCAVNKGGSERSMENLPGPQD